jgi:hypothetical protein
VRWWVLITSVDPLRVWIQPDAYLKTATSKMYDASLDSLQDPCIHVTNNKVQGGCHGTNEKLPVSILEPAFAEYVGNSKGQRLVGKKKKLASFERLFQVSRAAMVDTILPKQDVFNYSPLTSYMMMLI